MMPLGVKDLFVNPFITEETTFIGELLSNNNKETLKQKGLKLLVEECT
jgi:hypothetical protein